MNIAVSGANGSIAKDLLPFLEKHGFNTIKISNSLEANGINQFSFEDLKLNNIKIKVDIFIHLASFNSKLDEKNFKDEISLTKNVLDALRSLNCNKIIFFSSCKVYGEPKMDSGIVYSESYETQPNCFYSKAKLICEDLIKSEFNSSGLHSIILRLPPVINNSEKSNLVKLIKLSRLFPLPSFLEGESNKRSFLSNSNLKDALLCVINNSSIFHGNKLYNLCDSNYISFNNLLKIYSRRRMFLLPKFFSKIFLSIPLLKNIFIRLYGDQKIANIKFQNEMNVILSTTEQSLSIIKK